MGKFEQITQIIEKFLRDFDNESHKYPVTLLAKQLCQLFEPPTEAELIEHLIGEGNVLILAHTAWLDGYISKEELNLYIKDYSSDFPSIVSTYYQKQIEQARKEERAQIIDIIYDLLELSENSTTGAIPIKLTGILQSLKEGGK